MKIKHFPLLILILVLHFSLQAQTHNPHQIELTEAERFQKKGFIRGRLTELNTNSPICFANISTRNNKSVTKSNTRGEFLLFPNEFPTTLRISKFGFKEATIIINN